MKWYPIPGIPNLQNPFIKKVTAGDTSICLVGYDGEMFELSTYCPHAGADLSDGWCQNKKLICLFHGYAYDLHTGKGSGTQNDYIKIYPVKVTDDGVFIGIGSL